MICSYAIGTLSEESVQAYYDTLLFNLEDEV